MLTKQENKGVLFALISAAMWGIFPVMVNRGSQNIPPLTFAAVATLLAAFGTFIYAILKGKLHELKKKEAYIPLIMVTLCIVIIPYVLLFIGSSKTSGINTSLLLLSEIIFTLIFTPLFGEKTTSEKLVGAIGVFIGALLLLYNGKFQLNIGDILIVASTLTYPIGNFYAKKALNHVSPAIILFVRFTLGGLFIAALAMLVEKEVGLVGIVSNNWPLILFTGLISLSVGKIISYEALKRLDISKTISLYMTFPLFSLIVLIGVFGESVSTYQWMGIFIMAVGVYFSIKRPSVEIGMTKYAP